MNFSNFPPPATTARVSDCVRQKKSKMPKPNNGPNLPKPDKTNLIDHGPKRAVLVPIRSEGESLGMFNSSNDLKKAFNVRLSTGENYPLRRDMVYCFFDIPSVEAARIMCVSLTLLKKIRAWVKLDRWPCAQIHTINGECFGLTRAHIIQGRDDVISNLEKEYQDFPLERIKLAIKIVKMAREYAMVYACLVTPGTGGVQHTGTKVDGSNLISNLFSNPMSTPMSDPNSNPNSNPISRSCNIDSYSRMLTDGNSEGNDKSANEIMESMQPRQVVKRKTRISVMTTMEPEDCFWPISITQEFNFDQLFDTDGLEDELGLGPLAFSAKVSTTVEMGRVTGVGSKDEK